MVSRGLSPSGWATSGTSPSSTVGRVTPPLSAGLWRSSVEPSCAVVWISSLVVVISPSSVDFSLAPSVLSALISFANTTGLHYSQENANLNLRVSPWVAGLRLSEAKGV